MRYIVITCTGRELLLKAIKKELPEVEVSFDNFEAKQFKSSAWENYLNALEMAGNEPCVILEDDAVLCPNFKILAEVQIKKRPDDLITFFSLKHDWDRIDGYYNSGFNFLMNQCFYLPEGMANKLLNYCKTDFLREVKEANAPTDTSVSHFLKRYKKKYFTCIPNLVDHREIGSIIDRRRSSKRQSKSYFKHWYSDLPEYNTALGEFNHKNEYKNKEVEVITDHIRAFQNDASKQIPDIFSECDVFYTETSWMVGQKKFNKSAGISVGWKEYVRGLKNVMRFRKPFIVISSSHFEKLFFPAHQKFETTLNGGKAYCYVYNTKIPEIGSSIRILEYLSQIYDCIGDPSCGNGRSGYMFRKRGKKAILSDYDINCIKNIKEWI